MSVIDLPSPKQVAAFEHAFQSVFGVRKINRGSTLPPGPPRYEAGKRIVVTLQKMEPGSDQSFLVDSRETAHHVAKQAGCEIRTRKESGGKYRVWRLS